MAFNINIQELVKKEFGLDVNVSSFEPPVNILPFDGVQVITGGNKMVNGAVVSKYSAMGTPVYDYIKVKAGGYYDFQGNYITIEPYDFPFECIVELSQPSMIEETYIKGRKGGSIKEIIGVDDYYITIRGFIINYETSDYPTEAVEAFKRLINHTAELQVESPWLNFFDINEIVIYDRNLPQIEGAFHYQTFVLQCKSNEPFYVEV